MTKYNPDEVHMNYLTPNKNLMKTQRITKEYEQVLIDTYKQLTMVLERPDLYDNPVEYIEALEYTLQVLWGFAPNKNYHSYWYYIKGCICPKMDNKDLMGTDQRWYNGSCEWHGSKEK